jgi:endoribonuclease Dicer
MSLLENPLVRAADDSPTGYNSEDSADEETEVSSSPVSVDTDDQRQHEDSKRRAFEEQVLARTSITSRSQNEELSRQETAKASNRIIDHVREYQQELFERAKSGNIIAVLDTGMGKTLVAAMLIRHVLEQQSELEDTSRSRKHVFFLANSVPLVRQQARVLTSNLSASVQALFGSDNIDKWSGSEWQTILQDSDVIVCTAAVLDQALYRNVVQIRNLSLLIFDEAHHCKKNHPYSRIVRDYYLKSPPEHGRPRLFSMTASPVDSKRDVQTTIEELETLLHSKIVTVPDASLADFAYKPVDVCWEYPHLGPSIRTSLQDKFFLLGVAISHFRSVLAAALEASSHLGTWFSDRILYHTLGTAEAARNLYSKFEATAEYASMAESDREAVRIQLEAAPDIVRQSAISALVPDAPTMSPKVKSLWDQLEATFSSHPSARAMVFVEQRWTAVMLCEAFRSMGLLTLRPGYLTGSGTNGNESFSATKQENVMRDFNRGLVNVLFTTSVGEEGIDIPQCNIVVRFDPNHKTIQYIQSRGRARMKDSIYAHMVEKDNVQHRSDMQYLMDSADYLKNYCQQLPQDRLLGKGTRLAQMIAHESALHSFQTETGATCNFHNCLVILSRYANSLFYIGATTSETYEEIILESNEAPTYQYIVRLPVVGESTVRGAKGDKRPNKILARRAAAWKCVRKLRAFGLLDSNLDSKFKRPKRIIHRKRVNDKKSKYAMITKPTFWQNGLGETPSKLYAITIEFKQQSHPKEAMQAMVLLTRERLIDVPTFPIYVEDGVQVDIVFTQVNVPLDVSEAEVQSLADYTLNAIFHDVFHKLYELDVTKMSYWLIPLRSRPNSGEGLHSLVKFADLKAASMKREKWEKGSDPEKWCNAFLVDHLSGRHRYFTKGVVHGKTVFDSLPAEFLPKAGKKRNAENVLQFTDSHWQKKDRLTDDRDQPVIAAGLLTVRRNYLDRPNEKGGVLTDSWIAPSALRLARLSAAAARTALAWPSILHRIESYLIVHEGLSSIGFDDIPPALALEAFTKDSNIDDHEAGTHATKSRGMGKNYERLEFIGDSLLKLTSTISVYNRTVGDEADMHERRMFVLCNETLTRVSTQELHLYRYIRTSGFNRDDWYPQFLTTLGGRVIKHEDKSHDLGDKTIADVSEATIGAVIMSSKDQPLATRFDRAIQAITTLTNADDHRLSSWKDLAAQHQMQDWELKHDDPLARKIAREIENRLGYTFNHPRLARCAVTHPSDLHSPIPDYQRLEFLGDACYDWVAIWWLFQQNPDRNPEWLTEHKMAMVSNKFLATLAVLLGLDALFTVQNAKLQASAFAYARAVRALREEHPNEPNFWLQNDVPVPKALADIVEAIIGAMLVDSGFNFQPVEDFFFRHVEPLFRDITLYDGFARKHPTSLIYKTVTGQYGCRKMSIEIRDHKGDKVDDHLGVLHNEISGNETHQEPEEISAVIFIHGSPLAWSQGTSTVYTKTRASAKALRELDGLSKLEFREKFGCACGAERDVEPVVDG